MPRLDEIKEERPRYKITSDGTEPSYCAQLKHAELKAALRIGLGYKNTQITVLESEDKG